MNETHDFWKGKVSNSVVDWIERNSVGDWIERDKQGLPINAGSSIEKFLAAGKFVLDGVKNADPDCPVFLNEESHPGCEQYKTHHFASYRIVVGRPCLEKLWYQPIGLHVRSDGLSFIAAQFDEWTVGSGGEFARILAPTKPDFSQVKGCSDRTFEALKAEYDRPFLDNARIYLL